MQKSQAKEVYWEQQGIDQLCGVHTINSLLQGPFFDEIQMSQIGLNLDQREQALFGHQGKSENVAMDGNFSIQVLTTCLGQHKLQSESVDSQVNRNEDLSQEIGFICNSQSHWFAIRKVQGQWFNLNSCSIWGPQFISDFYLSAFLGQVKQGGYTIFVVRGSYPIANKSNFRLNKYQRFLPFDTVKKYDDYKKLKYNKTNLHIGAYEEQMSSTLEESKWEQEHIRNQEMPDLTQIESENTEMKKFSGQAVSLVDKSQQSANYQIFENIQQGSNADPELAFAIQQSLKSGIAEQFNQQQQQGITLRFQHCNGERSMWIFREDCLVEQLYDYAFFKTTDQEGFYKFYLSATHPTRKFENCSLTLAQAEVEDMDTIYVTKLA